VELGAHSNALLVCQETLEINRRVLVREEEIKNLNDLGALYISQGKHQKALEAYEKALASARARRDRANERTILNSMGAAYDNLGQREKAQEHYAKALEIRPDRKIAIAMSKRNSSHHRKKHQRPASTQLASPDEPNIDDLIREAVEKLRAGLLAFGSPDQMTQGKKEVVEARIASEPIGYYITEGFPVSGSPQVQPVKVGPVMKAFLYAQEDEFRITKLSNEEQVVSGKPYAQWQWEVFPLKSGIRILHLRATVNLVVPGINGEKPFDVPVLEKKIEVKVDYWYVVKEFATSAEGIRYIFGGVTIPSLIALGWAYWRKRKEKREEQERRKREERRIISPND
jgi:tetratricopeptide (TPR) repeat protein